jgi:hypothetical protein
MPNDMVQVLLEGVAYLFTAPGLSVRLEEVGV